MRVWGFQFFRDQIFVVFSQMMKKQKIIVGSGNAICHVVLVMITIMCNLVHTMQILFPYTITCIRFSCVRPVLLNTACVDY